VGQALERWRFGATDQESVARVEQELRQRFGASAETLGDLAARSAGSSDLIRAARSDSAAARRLFDALTAALPVEAIRRTGITVYDFPAGRPLAWAGRVSDIPSERIDGPSALFVRPGALGPGLIRVEPVFDRASSTRLATVAVEQVLGEVRLAPGASDTFVLSTSIVPVALSTRVGIPLRESRYTFIIPSSSGQLLVLGEVAPGDLAAARERWRHGTRAAILLLVALTLLLGAATLVDVRRRTRERRIVVVATAATVAALLGARLALWYASAPRGPVRTASAPIDLLLTALFLAALVWTALNLIERRRVARPHIRLLADGGATLATIAAVYSLAGALVAAIVWQYQAFLREVVADTPLDLLQFSLHPFIPDRLAMTFALVVLHAGVIWGAALIVRFVSVYWRRPRSPALLAAAVLAWIAGVETVVGLASWRAATGPLVPMLAALAAVGLCAIALSRPGGRTRRASQAARLGMLLLALLVPAVAMYPSLHAFANEAKERLVVTEFGPQAASQREDLSTRRLPAALEEIDAMRSLREFVAGSAETATPTTDRAFLVWSQTELARYRLTSAIELYGQPGRLVSHFALNLPEYTTADFSATSCDWDLVEEVSPFGSTERNVLRASRGICENGRPVGGIVVRAMLDYRTLPVSSAQSSYLESLRSERPAPARGAPGRDIEFVLYGWSRAPIYSSGTRVWELSDAVFEQMVEGREPHWTTVERQDESFRVYYLNDRFGIYALGFPLIRWFGHLVNLAELVALTTVLYILLVGGATVFNALALQTPVGGRALLREVRSSFYRKLWLMFVAAAVVPVIVLAIATRAYFVTQLGTAVEDAAVNTATIAQRLVEDYATLQQQGAGALEVLDDQIMVLVRRAIDQDVDLFTGPRLQATSQRDLYASGLLATRTPDEVYRRIAVDRLPTFVGQEEVGGVRYLIAAAPVRAGGRVGIVTVPQRLRQQEIEKQIDELDRRVVFASVLFVLLGAGVGYWMAERIADPVNRLTRATRRIARGDLDARIAATSSDELRRLVEDFNRMADDLKRQRVELERTQRLEAWAEMARQVAHDIKNPLTPIQLSAEHARRVNMDSGRPLSPVLDECVTSILAQVKLLRQIATEFSNFASSPTAHPEPTDLAALIDEVVEPYRAGLAGRIAVAVRAARDLPPVTIDRTLFARALTNVIENALHAMPGGGTLSLVSEVATGPRGAPSAVTVDIVDTGVGMDREAVARIFEPYFSTKATGTGLGLTIAKRNITLIGGTIAIESERAVGTTVRISIPIESSGAPSHSDRPSPEGA
jgi:signal transduction histidine kinase